MPPNIILKPGKKKNHLTPKVSWDEGIYRLRENTKSDKCLFLSFTWDNYLCLLEFKKKYSFTDEIFFLEPIFLGKISFPENFIYMGFISNGVIFAVDEKKNSFSIYSDDIGNNEESKTEIAKKLMEMDRYSFKCNKITHQIEGNINEELIYHNFIVAHRDLNVVYFVIKDEAFLKGEIYSPKSLINRFLI